MFVKVKENLPSEHQRELASTLRELSPTGVYKVVKMEIDQDRTFYYLMGGMTPHSAHLFNEVRK